MVRRRSRAGLCNASFWVLLQPRALSSLDDFLSQMMSTETWISLVWSSLEILWVFNIPSILQWGALQLSCRVRNHLSLSFFCFCCCFGVLFSLLLLFFFAPTCLISFDALGQLWTQSSLACEELWISPVRHLFYKDQGVIHRCAHSSWCRQTVDLPSSVMKRVVFPPPPYRFCTTPCTPFPAKEWAYIYMEHWKYTKSWGIN